jgi:prolyl oligopeptidase
MDRSIDVAIRFWALASATLAAVPTAAQSPRPPATPRGEVADTFFGEVVADPYRWLEVLDGADTRAWVAAQNEATNAYLAAIPARDSIRRRLTQLWDYPRVRVPVREGGRLFYRKNSGLQQQAVLYAQASLTGAPRVILDPNALSPDGSLALGDWSPSPDGTYLAYTLAQGGADLSDIKVRDLRTGQDLPGTVHNVKFTSPSWTKDSRGFFYSRYRGSETAANLQDANTYHQLWYHTARGTADDQLIYERPDHLDWIIGGQVSENGRYLLIYTTAGSTKNRLFFARLGPRARPDLRAPVRPLVDADEGQFLPLEVVGDTLYIQTNAAAPHWRVIAVTLPDTARSHWRTVVPERAEPISEGAVVGRRLAIAYLKDVQSQLRIYGLDGSLEHDIRLPDIGSASGLRGRVDTSELFYAFSSYLRPTTVYRVDIATGASVPFQPAASPFDARRYETKELFYSSRDGTRVPLVVTSRRDLVLDGTNPTLLYAYGGFDITIDPAFSPAVAGWLELGGTYAVANIRGGGEYGEPWHEAGLREKKQNVFDDLIAAAEYLIKERYTSPGFLAIEGGSNGGLLVGAVMTQRPDLVSVTLPEVGVMDMLRYQKFTGGQYWVEEFGSSDDSVAFQYLHRYSPYHNIRPGTCYPATLATTADHDDRVVPSHSYKFISALQAAQRADHPILIRVETQASHGYRPTEKVIAEVADQWAFAMANLRGTIACPRDTVP